jgi:hypothetical protein
VREKGDLSNHRIIYVGMSHRISRCRDCASETERVRFRGRQQEGKEVSKENKNQQQEESEDKLDGWAMIVKTRPEECRFAEVGSVDGRLNLEEVGEGAYLRLIVFHH